MASSPKMISSDSKLLEAVCNANIEEITALLEAGAKVDENILGALRTMNSEVPKENQAKIFVALHRAYLSQLSGIPLILSPAITSAEDAPEAAATSAVSNPEAVAAGGSAISASTSARQASTWISRLQRRMGLSHESEGTYPRKPTTWLDIVRNRILKHSEKAVIDTLQRNDALRRILVGNIDPEVLKAKESAEDEMTVPKAKAIEKAKAVEKKEMPDLLNAWRAVEEYRKQRREDRVKNLKKEDRREVFIGEPTISDQLLALVIAAQKKDPECFNREGALQEFLEGHPRSIAVPGLVFANNGVKMAAAAGAGAGGASDPGSRAAAAIAALHVST